MAHLEEERRVGLAAVQEAMRIARSVQSEIAPGQKDKEDRSPVTVGDLAVQAVISRALHAAFPDDPLMGEEGADELRRPDWAELLAKVVEHVGTVSPGATSENVLSWIGRGQQTLDPNRRYWVLDPIDGTKGFLRKGQYAIALALIERGEIVLGLLGCPNLPASLAGDVPGTISPAAGQIYFATRGSGAYAVNVPAAGEPSQPYTVRVAKPGDGGASDWCERVETSARNKDVTALVAERAGLTKPPYRIDSQAKYAVVSRGEAALYLRHTLDPNYREKVWDHAAGVIVMEEAGGRVTDLYGRKLDFSRGRELSANRGIVATNGPIHDDVLAAIKEILPQVEKPA